MSQNLDISFALRRGRLYLEEGHSAAALSDLQELHPEHEREQKELRYLLGWANTQLRRWDEAMTILSLHTLFSERERTIESLNSREIQGLCLLRLAEIAIQAAQYEEAGRHLLRALKVLNDRRVALPIATVKAYYFRATTYQMRGLYAAAIQDYRQALELCREQDEPRELAQIYNGLADVYRVSGSLIEAYETGRKALNLYRQLGDMRRQCEVLNRLGRTALKLGDYSEALDHYTEAMTIAGSDPRGDKMVMVNSTAIADLRLEQGRIDEAKRYSAIALAISNRVEDHFLRSLTDMIAGKVALAEARLAEGEEKRQALETAVAWFAKASEKLDSTQVQLHIAEIYGYQAQALEELGRHQDALGCWREAYKARSITRDTTLEEV